MTLEQVGQIIGVTKERVRQIQNKAMEKIRLELESKFLGTRQIQEPDPALASGPSAPQAGAIPQTPTPDAPREDLNALLSLN